MGGAGSHQGERRSRSPWSGAMAVSDPSPPLLDDDDLSPPMSLRNPDDSTGATVDIMGAMRQRAEGFMVGIVEV